MTGDSIETVEVARRLLRSASTASLATLDADGAPFATLVTMATDHDGAPLALLSRLAVHTANITAMPAPRCWSPRRPATTMRLPAPA